MCASPLRRPGLRQCVQRVTAAGIGRERIAVDPGIGFAKTAAHNLALLSRQRELLDLGLPLLVGWSRKGTLGLVTGRPVGARVAVTGALDNAAIYELKPGAETLGEVLALSGGVPALASTAKALLERIAPDQNPPRRVQDITLDSTGLRQPLLRAQPVIRVHAHVQWAIGPKAEAT